MGGCVVSLLDVRNRTSICPSKTFQDYQKIGQQGEPVPGSEIPGASAIYRIAGFDDAAHKKSCQDAYNAPNLAQRFQDACVRKPKHRALAYRVVDCIKEEMQIDVATGKGKPMNVTYFKETVYMDFETLWETVTSFGRGLVKLGVKPRSNVAIYEETCWQWFVTAYGIWTQDMVFATVYANLGEDALAYALRETESSALICGAKNASWLVKFMSEGTIPHAPIIYNGTLPSSFDDKGLKLYPWSEVVSMGRAAGESIPLRIPTDNNSICLIMYTSGTTGDPKGVIHTHGSLVAGMVALNARVLDNVGPYQEGETYCAYLPLAHIMEFTVLNIFLSRGAVVCFGTPQTLTEATARPRGDFAEFKPTVIIGVPRVFDTLKKAIEAKLPASGNLKREVFDHAFKDRLKALKEGNETPYWNKKVFALPRAILGENLRMILSGGAPLSAVTQDFVNVVLCTVVQGWGLTETVCVGAIQRHSDFETLTAGQMLPTEELRLLDTEGYKHTDTPEPRGEILLRGPFLFKGYYKQEKLTAEALDKDGWFHTGDVGSITKEGKVRVVGRVKALAKNVLGEYIAMEVLESIYAQNPLCMPNGACVLVNQDKPFICLLALTDEGKTMTFAKNNGLRGTYPDILKDPEFRKKATESFVQTGKEAHRRPFECPRYVRVLDDIWTPENGILTAAMKLKRRSVDEKYKDIIDELFKE